MGPPDTYRASILKAVQILGSAQALSDRLQVPLSEIRRWAAGRARPSMGTFLKVVDILVEDGRKAYFQSLPKGKTRQLK